MKTNYSQQFKAKKPADIKQELVLKQQELNQLKLDLKANKLKNTSQIKTIRYQISILKSL
ncbi:MAG: 50S ribosomal protein L29 [Candidatus Beckwithbacteria bacterium]